MNYLSHLLNRAAVENKLKYHSQCKSTKLTYLSFADDLLIFIDGSLESVQQVLSVLREFELRSVRYLGVLLNSRKMNLTNCEPHILVLLLYFTEGVYRQG